MPKPLTLIVDDEPDICELLELTLGRMNIDTRSAKNLAEARTLLDQHKFDLCLTDMRLPDGNGISLVEYIQKHSPDTPTAVITAHGSMESAIQALKAGAFDFVSKPVDLQVLRNLINSASLAFTALSSGSVGIGGSTAAVVERSLMGLRRLVDRSLTEVRLEVGIQNRERVEMVDFVEEVRVSAIMEADAQSIRFTVAPVEDGVAVEVDRQMLASVLSNLLQNAFKFSREGGSVTMTAREAAGRAVIEIADECGGLPSGRAQDLFLPFEQRGTDRSGVGLGLAICLRGVEANGGSLHVRDVPGFGCVFTVELPAEQSLVES